MPNSNTWVDISDAKIPAEAALSFLSHPNAGGTAVFLGTTRQRTATLETKNLFYEAYVPMTLAEMKILSTMAKERWPILRLVLLHRLGEVAIADTSVLIGVATPHRDAAFVACRWLIDNLKETVPIWKKETFHDGTSVWVNALGDQKGNSPKR